MELTHAQKKFLKKNLRVLPLVKIAQESGLTEKEILHYLKIHWPKEKLEKFLQKQKGGNIVEENYQGPELKTFFRANWKIFAFLILLVLLVYGGSLGNDFVSDDISGIKENAALGNFPHIINKPLSFLRDLFYFFAYSLGGLNPLPFRLINVFCHLGSTLLTFGIVSFLSGSGVAFFASALFAVHPLLSEPIVWISGGPYSQYAFFFLLSFFLYLLSAKYSSWKIYIASLFIFILSLESTEKAIILPLIFLIYEFSFNRKKNWSKILPFFGLSLLWFLLFLLQGALGTRITTLQTQYYQTSGLENPFLQVPIALSSYLSLFFWPKDLTLYHSELTFTTEQFVLMSLVALSYFCFLIFAFLKKRPLFFWLSFFLIPLLPTLTPLRLGWIVAERYFYLSSLGLIVPIVFLFVKSENITKNKLATYGIFGLILILFSIRTVIRIQDWKNQDTLWLATAKTSPSSPQNHNNLGDYYGRHGDLEKAVEEFKIAIKLQPNYADAYHNLANTYLELSKEDEAIDNFKQAIKFNPHLWQSYQNLAAIYFERKTYLEAEQNLQKAIKINPQNSILYTSLAIAQMSQDKTVEARTNLEKALELDPQNQTAIKIMQTIK